MNNILAVLAFAIFVAFLGILVWKVQRVDLMVVIGFTVALAGWDLLQTMRGNRG
ncbi:hypothetical protein [Pseudotabrizicola algicola]|uniref:hypothetical protein n=1 Tax=Pseudotabrizicola algicola TaxID=2709381 RepID=UPI001966DFFA|nr:hypothetical protein [Pseudotabrizicola algicola]